MTVRNPYRLPWQVCDGPPCKSGISYRSQRSECTIYTQPDDTGCCLEISNGLPREFAEAVVSAMNDAERLRAERDAARAEKRILRAVLDDWKREERLWKELEAGLISERDTLWAQVAEKDERIVYLEARLDESVRESDLTYALEVNERLRAQVAELRAALRLAVSAGECDGPWAYICDSSDQPHQHEQRDKWCPWCQAKSALAATEPKP